MVKPTDRDRVFVADFPAEGSRLGEANVMRLAWRSAADDAGQCGDELGNAPCRVRRMVLAATRRWRGPAVPGRTIGASATTSIGAAKGFSTGALVPFRRLTWTAGLPDQRLKPPRSWPACRENRLRPCPRRRRSACSWPKGCCGPSAQPHRRFVTRPLPQRRRLVWP